MARKPNFSSNGRAHIKLMNLWSSSILNIQPLELPHQVIINLYYRKEIQCE